MGPGVVDESGLGRLGTLNGVEKLKWPHEVTVLRASGAWYEPWVIGKD